jgi:hypothetical protein
LSAFAPAQHIALRHADNDRVAPTLLLDSEPLLTSILSVLVAARTSGGPFLLGFGGLGGHGIGGGAGVVVVVGLMGVRMYMRSRRGGRGPRRRGPWF